MWEIFTKDGIHCRHLNGSAKERRNIIKARTSIQGIRQ